MYYLILETATQLCSVALMKNEKILELKESQKKNSHAEVLTVFIQELLEIHKLDVKDLEAVAVSKGPGSYTGLRIGVSTAKGLCYAANKPLVAVNTLESMAAGMIRQVRDTESDNSIFCPMIDARRMEVYSALFDSFGREIRNTQAEIIDQNSFFSLLQEHKLIFFGDGAEKCRNVITHPNAVFIEDFFPSASYMSEIVLSKIIAKQFENVAYFEPFYLKDFIAGVSKVKGLR